MLLWRLLLSFQSIRCVLNVVFNRWLDVFSLLLVVLLEGEYIRLYQIQTILPVTVSLDGYSILGHGITMLNKGNSGTPTNLATLKVAKYFTVIGNYLVKGTNIHIIVHV